MNTFFKRILRLSFFIVLAIHVKGLAQQVRPLWISTGEYVSSAFSVETPQRFILGALECKIKDNGTLGDPFTDWGNIILSTNKNLNIQDSVYLKSIDEWYIMLYQALILNNGNILMSGPAYNPDSNQMKLGLIWMDESLNILHHSLVGITGKKIDPSGAITFNQAGNIVTYGHIVEEYGQTPPSSQYFFMEIAQNGDILRTLEQTLDFYAFYLWPIGANKYHMWSWQNTVIQLNENFGFESAFSLGWGSEFLNVRIKPYNLQSYFLLRDKMKFVFGHENPFFEAEVLHVDDQVNPLNTLIIGFENENVRGVSLSSYQPGVLFIGGTRIPIATSNGSSAVPNQIFIYKTDISGQILQSRFYNTTGGISSGSLLATSDGGCLIPVTYYRDYPAQDVFYLKMDWEGNFLGLEDDLVTPSVKYSIFPIPAKSHFTLQSTSVLPTSATIFSASGAMVKNFLFELSCRVDVSDFKPGVYMLQLIRADGYRESRKLLVTN